MNIQPILKSQYRASLNTLRHVIEKCPDAMWNDPADGPLPFWKVVYHTLFYTHLYLQPSPQAFTPWSQHQENINSLSHTATDTSCRPYTRQEMLEYWQLCDGMIDTKIDALDLTAPQCGFHWYKISTLEHQIVSIRHIQHHAAILSSRLRRTAGIDIEWIGSFRLRVADDPKQASRH